MTVHDAVPAIELPVSVPIWFVALVASENLTVFPLIVPLVIVAALSVELCVVPPLTQLSVQLVWPLPVNVAEDCTIVTAIALVLQESPPPVMLVNVRFHAPEISAGGGGGGAAASPLLPHAAMATASHAASGIRIQRWRSCNAVATSAAPAS